MRRPSARCQPHVVTLTYNTWDTDQDGGRRVDTSSTRSNVPCFVQPGEGRTILETSDADGLRRVTEFTPGKVFFVDNVSLKINDFVTWIDTTGDTHNYIVLGYNPPCSTSILYVASVEERL